MTEQMDVVLARRFSNEREREAVFKCFSRGMKKIAGMDSEGFVNQYDQALVFWQAVRGFSERVSKAVCGIRKHENRFESSHYADSLSIAGGILDVRAEFLREFADHPNPSLRLVADFESLTSGVLRRLMWHENVDFQSLESFLKRITPEQADAFRVHAQIAARNRTVDPKGNWEEYPCFSDGWVNKIANRFEKAEDRYVNRHCRLSEQRLASKAALAHNLFGWDFGFQRYSDEKTETANPTSLPEQALLSVRGEDFSVNTESRGVYWWLYKTLRCNSLWGEEDSVKLKSHVCPGFWMTVFAWTFFLLGSPALLLAGTASFDTVYGKAMVAAGMVTPAILSAFFLAWFFRKFGDEYDKKFFVGAVFIASLTVGIALLGHGLYEAAKWLDWNEPVNWLIVTFIPIWAGYALARERSTYPWQLPVFGPIFLVAIPVRAIWIGFERHPEEMLRALEVIAKGLVFIIGMAIGVGLVFLGYVGLKKLLETLEAKAEESAEKAGAYVVAGEIAKAGDHLSHERFRWISMLVMGVVGVLAFGGVLAAIVKTALSEGGIPLLAYSLGLILAYGVAVFVLMVWSGANSSYRLNDAEFERRILKEMGVWHDGVANAILENPHLHKGFGQFDKEHILFLLRSQNFLRCWHALDEGVLYEMVRKVTPDDIRYFVAARAKTHILPYVAAGMKYKEAWPKFRQDQAERQKREFEKQALKNQRQEATNGIKEAIADFFLFVPRMIGRVFGTLMMLKRTFDNHCPHIHRPKPVG